jgi:hypothetical protein
MLQQIPKVFVKMLISYGMMIEGSKRTTSRSKEKTTPAVYGEVLVPGAKALISMHYDGQPVNPAQWDLSPLLLNYILAQLIRTGLTSLSQQMENIITNTC